jgi:RNA polymerase sigma factor (sigma-70 family)
MQSVNHDRLVHPFPLVLDVVHDERRGDTDEHPAQPAGGDVPDPVVDGIRHRASMGVLRAAEGTHQLRGVGAAELLRRSNITEVRTSVTAEPREPGHLPPRVWAEVQERLRAFVRRRVGDPHAADDVAQEVLLRLHRNIERLRHEDRLDAFAYEIARNAVTDHYRAVARAREVSSPPTGLAARIEADANQWQQTEEPDARQQLVRCLEPLAQRLAKPYREALRRVCNCHRATLRHPEQDNALESRGVDDRFEFGNPRVRDRSSTSRSERPQPRSSYLSTVFASARPTSQCRQTGLYSRTPNG